jgi:energy-coupling factor transport system substrate-specific component
MRLVLLSALGIALFLWPLFGGTPPSYIPALAVAIAAVAVLAILELGARHLDSRGLALIAALAALDAGLRLALVTGIGGFSPVFFLILCAGFVFGPTFGFLTGALTLMVSALATGGIGPWLPYQVFAAGWVGAAAGLAMGRRLWVLAVIGAVTGLAFGALMDVWDWSTFYRGAGGFGWVPGLSSMDALQRFGRFYLVTSLAYDSFRSVGNVLMIWLLGPPVIAALERLRLRLTFERVDLPIASASLTETRPSP